jgi:hypothetical protein
MKARKSKTSVVTGTYGGNYIFTAKNVTDDGDVIWSETVHLKLQHGRDPKVRSYRSSKKLNDPNLGYIRMLSK